MISNHRQVYRVLQITLREGRDKKFLKSVERIRREGFGWRYDGLGDWTNEAIFDQLRTLGIDICEENFEQQAHAAGSTLKLEEQWRKGVLIKDKRHWDDFPFLASEELWKRLTPHLLCPEIVAGRIEAAFDRPMPDHEEDFGENVQCEIEAACVLMDYVEAFEPEQRQAAIDAVSECSTYDFGDWVIEVAARFGPSCLPQARRFTNVMSVTDYGPYMATDLADSLRRANQLDEAKKQANENLARWPDDFWVRIGSGSLFEDLGETELAVQCYTQALKLSEDRFDWDFAAEKVRAMLTRLGRHEDWNRLEEAHPRPPASTDEFRGGDDDLIHHGELRDDWIDRSQPLSDGSGFNAPLDSVTLSRGTRIGRNEPCPCGSGKKYKKCCLGCD